MDGLQIPLKTKMIIVKGPYFQKTHQGFFKTGYLILKNQELYLYNDLNFSELD